MAKTKTIHIFLITAVLFSSACFFASRKTAMAYSECDLIEDDTDKRKRKCEALEKKIEAYRQIIELKQKQGATLNNQISIMNAEIGQTETEIQVSEGKIESFTNKIGDLENKIKEKEELIVVQKKVLSELIRAYYEYNQQNVFNTMIKDSGFSQFMSEEDRIVQIGDGVREMLSSIMALKTDMENNKKEAEEKKNGVTDLKYQLEESNADLEAGKAQKNLLLAQTQGDEARYQARLQKVKAQQMEILRKIKDIEYGKLGDIDFSKLPKFKNGYLEYPVKNVRITQGYGEATWTDWYDFHNGVDFGINYEKVYAPKSGKVLATGNNGTWAYGKWMVIDHGDGLATLYAHLSKISASEGEKVKRGKKIATSGGRMGDPNAGSSTGPHLHFTVFAENTFGISYINGLEIPTGGSINPYYYLP